MRLHFPPRSSPCRCCRGCANARGSYRSRPLRPRPALSVRLPRAGTPSWLGLGLRSYTAESSAERSPVLEPSSRTGYLSWADALRGTKFVQSHSSSRARSQFTQQLQALCRQCAVEENYAREIAARPVQAFDDPSVMNSRRFIIRSPHRRGREVLAESRGRAPSPS